MPPRSRLWLGGLLAAWLVLPAPAPAQDSPALPPPYTINPGDLLSVTVWKEPDLERPVVVRPDGFFSFPLAGDVQAIGKTVEEVREELVQRLAKFIPDPVVTVATEQIQGNKVYVIGQVQRPGEFVANTQLDVMQALSIAGGTTPFAQLDDIKILRRSAGVLQAIPFQYGDIEKGRKLGQNILLRPGDVVVVP